MIRIFFSIIIVLISTSCFSQGSLLLVGGGSESDGGWSDIPYQWAVNQSSNKRVAIVGYSSNVTNWLPNYFKNLGANQAKNITISSQAVANQQATYDTLMSYDVIFLRGGDQWNYYQYYNNTLTEQALKNKFQQGGILGGTSAGCAILSEVFFSAETGTVYPDEVVINTQHSDITLKNDFLNVAPKLLFDTHFSERGRFGRLVGMLVNWYQNENELISSIGVDDKTAVCIDTAGNATVYGTGVATLITNLDSTQIFNAANNNLNIKNVSISQVPHNGTFDIATFQTTIPNSSTFNINTEESRHNAPLYMSGDNDLVDNIPMIDAIINGSTISDTFLVVAGDANTATTWSTLLSTRGAANITSIIASPSNANSAAYTTLIEAATQVLFVNNDYDDLMPFINSNNGQLLLDKCQVQTVGFVGKDSRFAGASFIKNLYLSNASYYHDLALKPAFNLLKNVVVIPITYDNSNRTLYENTITAAPYSMVKDSIKHGLWISYKSYVKYEYLNNSDATLVAKGVHPTMILNNIGTDVGLVSQPISSSNSLPRQIATFHNFQLTTLPSDSSFVINNFIVPTKKVIKPSTLKAYPNPAKDFIVLENITLPYGQLDIFTIDGKLIRRLDINRNKVNINFLTAGIYKLVYKTKEQLFETSLIIER